METRHVGFHFNISAVTGHPMLSFFNKSRFHVHDFWMCVWFCEANDSCSALAGLLKNSWSCGRERDCLVCEYTELVNWLQNKSNFLLYQKITSKQVSLTPAAQCRASFEPCNERRLDEQKSPVLTAQTTQLHEWSDHEQLRPMTSVWLGAVRRRVQIRLCTEQRA